LNKRQKYSELDAEEAVRKTKLDMIINVLVDLKWSTQTYC